MSLRLLSFLLTSYLALSQLAIGVANGQTRALFEPETGCYLGAYIDFDSTLSQVRRDQNGTPHALPEDFETTVGKSHTVYFFYLGYGTKLPLDWVRELALKGKFVHIALEPNGGLKKVKEDSYLRGLADDLSKSGACVFLRFASEMNGDWTAYHSNPVLYRRKFRLVYRVMHERARNVALVWCPFVWPREKISWYYPGDDATDWVGLNLYSVLYHNNLPNDRAEHERPVQMLKHFYNLYSPKKPVMICEYGATHQAELDGYARPEFASSRIQDVYSALPTRFSRVKCINYFDADTLKFTPGQAFNDYSVTSDPDVLQTYRRVIASSYFLGSQPPDKGAKAASLFRKERIAPKPSERLISFSTVFGFLIALVVSVCFYLLRVLGQSPANCRAQIVRLNR